MTKADKISVYAQLSKEKQALSQQYDSLAIAQDVIAHRMAEITVRIHKIIDEQTEIKDLVTGK